MPKNRSVSRKSRLFSFYFLVYNDQVRQKFYEASPVLRPLYVPEVLELEENEGKVKKIYTHLGRKLITFAKSYGME
jgi:hypothetical protein